MDAFWLSYTKTQSSNEKLNNMFCTECNVIYGSFVVFFLVIPTTVCHQRDKMRAAISQVCLPCQPTRKQLVVCVTGCLVLMWFELKAFGIMHIPHGLFYSCPYFENLFSLNPLCSLFQEEAKTQ